MPRVFRYLPTAWITRTISKDVNLPDEPRTRSGYNARLADKQFAALHESAIDAVDGSSTSTEVPWMWGPRLVPNSDIAAMPDRIG